MLKLKGDTIFLRALEPGDLDFLYQLENDESIWEVSETLTPYSKFILKQYLRNSHKDIYEVKQLRLAISDYDKNLLGLVDLFDFNPKNSRAGIGIVVLEKERKRGVGKEALKLISEYSFHHLNIHQLYANIAADNTASVRLFSNMGFKKIGVKKDWNYVGGSYVDELLFQKINK
ncbi:GNAT family N-acetyltransferase [Leptobacterium flavescens]|uniref:GNAT family N-acetyltransferase n=1 Tax=Leptobacterium flavescens TaxID=472055 RepID=A0A6P0USE0_9FLAO|nr:GNAT family N-acetyltransferase [Leptobacterium flavescens]NER13286.1 GNAT family N-acetyltransferase [Leptobacterium flavescens]